MRETLEKFKMNWKKEYINVKEIKGKKYLTLNSDLIALYDLLSKGYNLFFIPKNTQNFEIENAVYHDKDYIYRVVECENKYSREYLIEVKEEEYVEIKKEYKGIQLLEIEETNAFKDKLLMDFNDIILDLTTSLDENYNKEFQIVIKKLIFIFNKLFDKIFELNF